MVSSPVPESVKVFEELTVSLEQVTDDVIETGPLITTSSAGWGTALPIHVEPVLQFPPPVFDVIVAALTCQQIKFTSSTTMMILLLLPVNKYFAFNVLCT